LYIQGRAKEGNIQQASAMMMETVRSSETPVNITGLRGGCIPQKILLFIVIVVRTWN
jgi:hypothetical protein